MNLSTFTEMLRHGCLFLFDLNLERYSPERSWQPSCDHEAGGRPVTVQEEASGGVSTEYPRQEKGSAYTDDMGWALDPGVTEVSEIHPHTAQLREPAHSPIPFRKGQFDCHQGQPVVTKCSATPVSLNGSTVYSAT